jgi:uncharacterized membrane protein (DUF485 family)
MDLDEKKDRKEYFALVDSLLVFSFIFTICFFAVSLFFLKDTGFFDWLFSNLLTK